MTGKRHSRSPQSQGSRTNDTLEALRQENVRLKAENLSLARRAAEREAGSGPSGAGSDGAGNRGSGAGLEGGDGTAGTSSGAGRAASIARKTAVVVLVAVAALLVTVGNLLFWAGNTLIDQARFEDAVQPVIRDPAVQQSAALYATNSIYNNIDVQQRITEVLPPRADFLAPQLAGQAKSATQSALQNILARPEFQDRWNNVLSTQHERLIDRIATYQGNGDISLNDLYNQLTASLTDTRLAFLAERQLPPQVGTITVVSAPWLPTAHNVVVHIDTWRLLAVAGVVVCVALAVWLSRNRRRTLYAFVTAVAGLMILTLIGLWIARENILGKVDPQYVAGVDNAVHIISRSLLEQTWVILVTLVGLGLAAWISGESRNAVRFKERIVSPPVNWLHRHIFATAPVSVAAADSTGAAIANADIAATGAAPGSSDGKRRAIGRFNPNARPVAWVRQHKPALQWAIVAAFILVIVLTGPGLATLFWYVLIVLLLVMVVEVVGEA